MADFSTHIRSAVRRRTAEQYLQLMLVSFAITVVMTRLILTLTGFPKIGSGEFHIAHLLWGGLLLFIANLVVLIWANRWVYVTGGILSGIGAGLFIDEVGKFITMNNDYFFPLAIPIIYAFFLVVLLIYLRVGHAPISHQPRAELYRALDLLQDVLDHDLSERERELLEAQLKSVAAQTTNSDLSEFAQTLLSFLERNDLNFAPERPSFLDWIAQRAEAFEAKYIGADRLKFILTVGLAIFGLFSVSEVLSLVIAASSPDNLTKIVQDLIATGQATSVAGVNWFFVRLGLEGLVGLLLLIASGLFMRHQDRQAENIGYLGLLLSLTVVNLLVFYFAQFGNIVLTLIQSVLLFLLIYYRRHYLPQTKPPDSTA